uniref:Reverse transcriptase domain-containing protein n=1 Tax=Dendroctonus ponderosae TaxID=77166 RepID=A0AAR5PIR3_DENPD
MEEIVRSVRGLKGYKMGDAEIQIMCYADHAALIAEGEDDLQRLLHLFNLKAKSLNMEISPTKTKCLKTSKTPLRSQLELDGRVIEQKIKFNYLRVELSGFGDTEAEVRYQATKAIRIAGCLNAIWCNRRMGTDSKSRIYKIVVRPMMTYTAETRPETMKTKRLLETAEMKILRRITGKTLLDRARSKDIRTACNVKNINEWVANRKKEWNEHISRMDHHRLVRIAREVHIGTKRRCAPGNDGATASRK